MLYLRVCSPTAFSDGSCHRFNTRNAASAPGDAKIMKAGITSKQSNSVQASRSNSSKSTAKPSTNPDLPIYSYRDFSSIVTTVYTRHEEETNDLVQALRGLTLFNRIGDIHPNQFGQASWI